MLNFPENAGRETRMRLAADWLSERMQAEPVADKGRTPGAPEIVPPTADRDELRRCLRACDGDYEKRVRYCNSIRNPKRRLACRLIQHGTRFACRNWCHWHFDD